jgi:hypothetical protein
VHAFAAWDLDLAEALALLHVRSDVDATLAWAARDLGRFLARVVALVLDADVLYAGDAGVADDGSIAIVRVDADQSLALASLDAIDGDVALVHGLAVSATAVQLAEVVDEEVLDADGSSTVVLDDFVVGALGATTDDVGCARLLLDGDGVLAHGLEPDVFDGALAHAVDALALLGSDDDVLELAAILNEEDSVLVAAL